MKDQPNSALPPNEKPPFLHASSESGSETVEFYNLSESSVGEVQSAKMDSDPISEFTPSQTEVPLSPPPFARSRTDTTSPGGEMAENGRQLSRTVAPDTNNEEICSGWSQVTNSLVDYPYSVSGSPEIQSNEESSSQNPVVD